MKGIVSVTLTSILSHTGRGGQGRCFEIVSYCSFQVNHDQSHIRPGTRSVFRCGQVVFQWPNMPPPLTCLY